MAEPHAVRVDADTYRLIGDLAHLTGRTRKDVVRDAVRALASLREVALDDGLDRAADRLALAGARHRGLEPVATRDPGSGATAPHTAGPARARGRIGAARETPMVMARMSPAERLEAGREALERAIAEVGARRPRIVDSAAHGYLPEHTVIGVELDDPAAGWQVFAHLGAVALAEVGIDAYFVQVGGT
ncbi:hypothetical protein EDM22_03670 [Agromyces tardus]|uniref:Uncharacterized protein n=2 Tax=Agromyces tardus TaxID=2583849 RepID=A0A3M8AK87_9MICO|nr:hypothetical protein EDM22_03670 [Agromyces tardus]